MNKQAFLWIFASWASLMVGAVMESKPFVLLGVYLLSSAIGWYMHDAIRQMAGGSKS